MINDQVMHQDWFTKHEALFRLPFALLDSYSNGGSDTPHIYLTSDESDHPFRTTSYARQVTTTFFSLVQCDAPAWIDNT